MECAACHTANPDSNRFCENCGGALSFKCAACGFICVSQAKFCGGCGTSLINARLPTAKQAAPVFAWAELKQATVLFADIVGSTELVAKLDPEQAMGRLRPAVLRMRASVERFGGTVVRTLGDGVMVLFGVPRALEGHALLACEAALHMQEAFRGSADGLSIRIGLHSGQVASDPEDAHGGYGGGAHGVTIHLASRVVALAEPGGICLTQACRALAGPGCETQSQGRHQLKGIPGLVEILTLTHVRATAPHRAGGELGLTTFRGRQREHANLVGALELENGQPQVLGIAGDAGAGKSRLCQEFTRLCTGRGIPVFEVRAQLHGHALPLQPILELFRVHFFGIGPGDSPASARARIANRFLTKPPADTDLARLYEFFGVADPGGPPLPLGPRAGHARLLALIAELVRKDADATRVILIEDLHWLDQASAEFVSALVDAVPGTRTLLLLNYRTSFQPPWSEVSYFRELELGELPVTDMDALVAELLAPVTDVSEIARLVCRRAGGNPFFAEELVRTLVEGSLLAAGTGLPTGGLDALERALPATVQAVVGARLDRLGEPEKTLLQMCAIIGKEIPLAVLEHVASPLASQIEKGLEGLCAARLILPQHVDGGRRFAFRHPLIQEVAYSSQLKVHRGQVHASVATAMELYYHGRLDEYAGLVGYHFEEAGAHLEAARYNARAGLWVGSTNAAQAIKYWRKVRHLLANVARNPEVDRLQVTAGGKIALLGWREGLTLEEVKPLIDDAMAVANEVDDRLIPWLLTIEGRMLVASGGPADGYVDCVKKALLYIDFDRDAGRVAVAHAFLSQAYAWAGLLQDALAANDVALANAAHVDPFDREFIGFSVEQWVLGIRARLLIRMGRFEEASRCLGNMLEQETMSAEPPMPGMARFGFIELAMATADVKLAQQHALELHCSADEFATPYLGIFMHGYHGLASTVAGEHEAALKYFERALALIRSTGAAKEFESEVLASLAECRLRLGHYQQAHAQATEAIELSRLRTTRVAQCRALITRGAAALADKGAPDREAAEDDFLRAEDLIGRTGAVTCRTALDRARQWISSERAT
jgi:class 3 adenylate cyclase/tetratricopeptide (TPR) repeat protein